MTLSLMQKQRGSTLLVALILLLVITLLALSGARETALEARITGNFIEQQKLNNDAEAALREGEIQITSGHKPAEPNCADGNPYCLLSETPEYPASYFATSKTYELVADDTSTQLWYALPTPSGAEEGESENPEYGNMLMGIGTFRYEVNAQSTHNPTGNKVQLRSNIAKVYN